MLQSCSFDGEDRIDKVSEAVEEDYNGVEFKHVIVTEGAGGNKCEQGEDIAVFDSAGQLAVVISRWQSGYFHMERPGPEMVEPFDRRTCCRRFWTGGCVAVVGEPRPA
ncbi:unnamed protein product [Phytophthora lilii]|uniref:Unnamed protein product n=1 Tax=Phytophthora lilii TaxID=2077276 RepID=A0A9W6WQT7_9STRA|nr:unnamed protein product [Phytophthora lilii]